MYLDKNTGLPVIGQSASGGDGSGECDLSFVTAQAEDIRQGKVGASPTGSPVYGTATGGGDTSREAITKAVLIFG